MSALHVPNPRERETNGGRAKGGRAKGEGWRLMRRPAETNTYKIETKEKMWVAKKYHLPMLVIPSCFSGSSTHRHILIFREDEVFLVVTPLALVFKDVGRYHVCEANPFEECDLVRVSSLMYLGYRISKAMQLLWRLTWSCGDN